MSFNKKGLGFIVIVLIFVGLIWFKSQNLAKNSEAAEVNQSQGPTGIESQSPVPIVSSEPQANEVTENQEPLNNPNLKNDASTSSKNVETTMTAAQKSFHQLTENVNAILPTQRELQNLPEEKVHFTPEVIQNAAVGIGQIAQAIQDDPSLITDGLAYYRECAEKQESPNSIRASCYFNHEELLLQNKEKYKEVASLEKDPRISERIKHLAAQLQP